MHDHPVALITGANKGIGREIAKQLAAHGHTVLLGARELARGQAAARQLTEELTAERATAAAAAAVAGAAAADPSASAADSPGQIIPLQLDVTDAASIAAAAAHLRAELGRLDVLINNAGIARGPSGSSSSLEELQHNGQPSTAALDDIRAVFETNVFGVIAVTQAMLPLLRQAPAGRIVNVSSLLGSPTFLDEVAASMRGVGGIAYGPSKSALNAITLAFAHELADTPIKVNAACPGYTATDLNAHSGPRTPTQAARTPVRLALLGADGPTGTFSNDDGPLPW